ncbi:Rho termination factor N-terminal domain-containing protein [Actinophytocola algeriensis]|uniref:Rho termination factor-like N-terminal domain-containing protein n=1 Tax=Actinophytocola algeriensis TaxID=1768010 RepID=A0A7W7VJX0_9PSEU|nr:Rho termination factor N-terminal domain-containing protein [Actinophytocola algeriensis]MBB4912734.1 hypothetical protein [Actinophytocola algeriensis]MBE1473598.1 hypothetical protein [Actinophytocola algeriensis]
MAEQPGNQTPNTLDVNETDLREMKVDELRSKAWELDVFGVSDLRKEELVHAVGGRGGGGDDTGGGGGGGVRTDPGTSKSLKYSQEITSTDDDPERRPQPGDHRPRRDPAVGGAA